MMEINKAIKKMMIDKDIQANQLAEKLSTTKQNLSRILNTNTDYKISTLNKIANAMDCEVKITFKDKRTNNEVEAD